MRRAITLAGSIQAAAEAPPAAFARGDDHMDGNAAVWPEEPGGGRNGDHADASRAIEQRRGLAALDRRALDLRESSSDDLSL